MADKVYVALEWLLAVISIVIIAAVVVSGLCFICYCYKSAVSALISSLVFIAGSAA